MIETKKKGKRVNITILKSLRKKKKTSALFVYSLSELERKK